MLHIQIKVLFSYFMLRMEENGKKHFPNKNRVNQNCCFLLDLLFSTKYVFVNIHKQNLYIDLVGRGI